MVMEEESLRDDHARRISIAVRALCNEALSAIPDRIAYREGAPALHGLFSDVAHIAETSIRAHERGSEFKQHRPVWAFSKHMRAELEDAIAAAFASSRETEGAERIAPQSLSELAMQGSIQDFLAAVKKLPVTVSTDDRILRLICAVNHGSTEDLVTAFKAVFTSEPYAKCATRVINSLVRSTVAAFLETLNGHMYACRLPPEVLASVAGYLDNRMQTSGVFRACFSSVGMIVLAVFRCCPRRDVPGAN
ncbi:hypothetical protein EXIGLDRAFT_840831 [Exidia glandulosa HHB12029]|uniref:Uncharacterized protein n=1 Tax=Exidia glandulosa HHB12029 TaxID=1314781 RepID=A0A165ZWZ9_EXIGL|nr:hypothetical protein EXIGLDRAFT_840831 [Exidia glandulosa HHB12029]